MPPSEQPVVEPAAADELDRLADCWVRLAREQREHGSRVRAEANRETIREVLAAHRVADGLFVARLSGSIVGFATFSVERGSFELDATRGLLSNLWVDPAHRDRGVGSALLSAVESALADRGVEVCTLEAMATNDGARRFYRRHGYDTYRVAMERRLGAGPENDTHSKDDA
ncbi:GNAT family N-acetyltransferase [Halovivax sp.]|uniref:GNAT family N-acetyltransferase n=1 Tax=Halovivax sp. TaxID=1935978 RepID=UPI0025C24674|nr:GNAT family N-acetyltransferase [Halovivax sp.]